MQLDSLTQTQATTVQYTDPRKNPHVKSCARNKTQRRLKMLNHNKILMHDLFKENSPGCYQTLGPPAALKRTEEDAQLH